MKEKKPRPPYKTNPQEILSKDEAKELSEYLLAERGRQASFAREIGKSTVAVSGWIKNQQFPKYCGLFLSKIKMKEFLKGA